MIVKRTIRHSTHLPEHVDTCANSYYSFILNMISKKPWKQFRGSIFKVKHM